jgi:hypothetical protein
MGGMVKIITRLEDKSVHIHETSSGFMKAEMAGSSVMSEAHMRKVLESEFMEKWKPENSLFRPYASGLMLVDFSTKKVFSLNSHAAFMNPSSCFIKMEYVFLARMASNGSSLNFSNPKSKFGLENIQQVFDGYHAGATISYKSKKYAKKLGHTMEYILADINGSNLLTQHRSKLEELYRVVDLHWADEDIEDIEMEFPGWTIEQGFGDHKSLEKALLHCIDEDALTSSQILTWGRDLDALQEHEKLEKEQEQA